MGGVVVRQVRQPHRAERIGVVFRSQQRGQAPFHGRGMGLAPEGLPQLVEAVLDDLQRVRTHQHGSPALDESAEDQLEQLIAHIHAEHPGLPVILDAKRGDIGSTAEQYAIEAFDRYKADAVTVNPYMGFDSVQPYLEHDGKGVIVLCRTSNAGGSDLQFLEVDGTPLYQVVARLAAEKWNASGQLGLVVGATFPREIEVVRSIVGDMPLLIPGIGAQGGDVEATVRAGRDSSGKGGMLINSSRAIIYAAKGDDFADAAAEAARQTRDAINAVV